MRDIAFPFRTRIAQPVHGTGSFSADCVKSVLPMTITKGDVYRSGPWMQSLDFVGGGLPSYAIVRTVIRFGEGRATFRDVIELDYRAEFEESSFDRNIRYSGGSSYVTFENDACTLLGHRPSPTTIVIISATRLAAKEPDGKPHYDNYLMRFEGFVFEKVTDIGR